MATLNDEQLRALRFLARHTRGCTEATLLEHGFTAGQLGYLVYAGLAKLRGESRPKLFRVKNHRGGTEGDRGWCGLSSRARQEIWCRDHGGQGDRPFVAGRPLPARDFLLPQGRGVRDRRRLLR
jgi:hypothetical protein